MVTGLSKVAMVTAGGVTAVSSVVACQGVVFSLVNSGRRGANWRKPGGRGGGLVIQLELFDSDNY